MQRTKVFLVLPILFLAFIFTGIPSQTRAAADASHFTYARLYCTADGESHFQNVTVELAKMNFAPPAAPLLIGGKIPAESTFFSGFEQNWGTDDLKNHLNHPTPAVQFIIVLKGAFSISATDGETRQFSPGEVLRLEDVSPCKGHVTVVGDQPGFLMFAPERAPKN
jgi:hypothetical protein